MDGAGVPVSGRRLVSDIIDSIYEQQAAASAGYQSHSASHCPRPPTKLAPAALAGDENDVNRLNVQHLTTVCHYDQYPGPPQQELVHGTRLAMDIDHNADISSHRLPLPAVASSSEALDQRPVDRQHATSGSARMLPVSEHGRCNVGFCLPPPAPSQPVTAMMTAGRHCQPVTDNVNTRRHLVSVTGQQSDTVSSALAASTKPHDLVYCHNTLQRPTGLILILTHCTLVGRTTLEPGRTYLLTYLDG